MKRTLLLNLLNAYTPSEPEELLYKEEMLEFLQKEENCFERSLEIGHFTASSWLLNKTKDQALLMHHAKLNIWCQLGGHCDGESDLLAVAIKEAKEESGISKIAPLQKEIYDIDIHVIPANPKEKEHKHYDIRFLLYVVSEEQPIQNHESKALLWIDKKNSTLPSQEQSILRMHKKWQKLDREEPDHQNSH